MPLVTNVSVVFKANVIIGLGKLIAHSELCDEARVIAAFL